MAISKLLAKEQVTTIINNLRINIPIDVDYIYDVYEAANEVIEILDKQTAQIEVKEVNQFDLVLYSVGEYFYSVSNLKVWSRINIYLYPSLITSKRNLLTVSYHRLLL